MKLAAHTLGCKLNFAETSHYVRQFVKAGWEVVKFQEKADLYIINTCTVTAVAEKKCRNIIRQATSTNPRAQIAVIGCFAQNNYDQISQIPGVTLILGNDHKDELLDIVQAAYQSGDLPGAYFKAHSSEYRAKVATYPFKPLYSMGDRTRTFFKVQDGCDYFCSYCAIPFARSRSRSATIAETMAVAQEIADKGVKEVVLTGVNTGTFGQQHGETFLDLLKELDKLSPILRYRISSIEPQLITDEIIDFVAHSRAFLPHFHIPLQSGSDKVLSMMRRHYDTALYRERIEYIKKVMPNACIAADVIAGFHGESEEEFAKSMEFIESLPLSYLHVFTYSERPNTSALCLQEKVGIPVRREHSRLLHELSDKKRKAFLHSQMGMQRRVLWESTKYGSGDNLTLQGWTDNYIRLQHSYDAKLVNNITLEKICDTTLVKDYSDEEEE